MVKQRKSPSPCAGGPGGGVGRVSSRCLATPHPGPPPQGGREKHRMQTNFTPEQLRDPDVAASNQVLRTCVHCGFCTATCPTFVLLGDELDSPRGRIYLIKDMLESGRPATEEVVRHVDRCLSCLSCMTTCPSGVNYMHLVDHARTVIERTYRRPWHDRAAARRCWPPCCRVRGGCARRCWRRSWPSRLQDCCRARARCSGAPARDAVAGARPHAGAERACRCRVHPRGRRATRPRGAARRLRADRCSTPASTTRRSGC